MICSGNFLSSSKAFFAVMMIITLPTNSAGQDWRSILGVERTQLIESVSRVVFPGCPMRWDGKVRIMPASGIWKPILFPGLAAISEHGGQLILTGIEFPDDAKEAVRLVKSFSDVSTGFSVTRLLVMRVNNAGRVLEHRTGVLDTDSIATECRSVAIDRIRSGSAWPLLRVRYRSWHRSEKWVGGLEWNATIASDGMTVLEHVPLALWRKRSDGTEVSDALGLKRLDNGTVELHGVSTGRTMSYRCAVTCNIPARVVLESF